MIYNALQMIYNVAIIVLELTGNTQNAGLKNELGFSCKSQTDLTASSSRYSRSLSVGL